MDDPRLDSFTNAYAQTQRGTKRMMRREWVVLVIKIAARDGWSCWICTKPLTLADKRPNDCTIDHVEPHRLDGPGALHNLRLAHRKCNQRRNARKDPTKRGFCERCGEPRDKLVGRLCQVCSAASRDRRGERDATLTTIEAKASSPKQASELKVYTTAPKISDLCEAELHALCVMPACACHCHAGG